jgi:cold shock CspA family protein
MEDNEDVMTGRVLRWDPQKFYGFLQPDINGANQFFHGRNVLSDVGLLAPGVRVRYELGEHTGRPCAINLEVINDD